MFRRSTLNRVKRSIREKLNTYLMMKGLLKGLAYNKRDY